MTCSLYYPQHAIKKGLLEKQNETKLMNCFFLSVKKH